MVIDFDRPPSPCPVRSPVSLFRSPLNGGPVRGGRRGGFTPKRQLETKTVTGTFLIYSFRFWLYSQDLFYSNGIKDSKDPFKEYLRFFSCFFAENKDKLTGLVVHLFRSFPL